MKYVVVLTDGAGDYPIDSLGGKTPLEASETPNMDMFASEGKLFLVKTVGEGLKPGSDVANLCVMGYNPYEYYTGRSPLEAASIGVVLTPSQTAFRANTVTLSDEENYEDKTMVDYSAGEISTEESRELILSVRDALFGGDINLYPGVSYRHLFTWDNAPEKFNLTPPHDISDKKIKDYLPDNERILDLMKKSEAVLKNHPVNLKRIAEGKNPANSIWVWGEGKKPLVSSFEEKYGLKGAVVSAVDLIKGIGILAEMNSIDVEGVTGNLHTNFDGKAKAAVDALLKDNCDLVYVHLEAPDECGHQGDAPGKVKSLELIDEKIIGYIKKELDKAGEDYIFMVMPDHYTPVAIKTHSGEDVPCIIYRKGDNNHTGYTYTEKCANEHGEYIALGHTLMQKFIDMGK
ncbi:MAG: cofactor-independent phosphoglycerate mutase [Clostridia bacterium]